MAAFETELVFYAVEVQPPPIKSIRFAVLSPVEIDSELISAQFDSESVGIDLYAFDLFDAV